MTNLRALVIILSAWLTTSVAYAAGGNDAISQCVDQSDTTYAKKKCEKKYKGITLDFEGEVRDILNERKLHIMLDTDNYADVVFTSDVAELVKKGGLIKFKGRITSFGTGILISHDINNATMKPLMMQ